MLLVAASISFHLWGPPSDVDPLFFSVFLGPLVKFTPHQVASWSCTTCLPEQWLIVVQTLIESLGMNWRYWSRGPFSLAGWIVHLTNWQKARLCLRPPKKRMVPHCFPLETHTEPNLEKRVRSMIFLLWFSVRWKCAAEQFTHPTTKNISKLYFRLANRSCECCL